MLDDLASNCFVVAPVIDTVSKEDHIHLYKEQEKFWSSLQSLMSTSVKGIAELFICVYRSCQTGKDKYCMFQPEWHKQCSMLLIDQVNQGGHKDLFQMHQRWLKVVELLTRCTTHPGGKVCVSTRASNASYARVCSGIYSFHPALCRKCDSTH